MSDVELRKILRDVMEDLDRGRLRLRNRVARGVVLPAALVAGLGLAACETDSVGPAQDARPDVQNIVDAAYMGPVVDGGVDAEVVADADIADSGPQTLYMGPPPIDPE